MRRAFLFPMLLCIALPLVAQDTSDPVAQALSQGDLYQSKHKFDLALDAYHKADKLAHHSSASCYLKIASVERKLGDFSAALDDSKRAVKAAGDNKSIASQAHLVRATLLSHMAGKPSDKKLREAEDEIRQALSLDPSNSIAHLDLGMVLLQQERDADGLPELNTFVSSPGADPATVAEARRIIANPIRARAPFAPDFSFTTLENQPISNAGLRGKVVLLDFWGTWCPPCRESIPILRDINKKFSGKPFQLVGISSDDDEDVWKTFIAAQHMDWSEYIDSSDAVQSSFKIDSFPTYIVLDKDGVIRYRQSGLGSTTAMELDEAISKAIKRPSDPKLATAMAKEAESDVFANAHSSSSAVSSSASAGSVALSSTTKSNPSSDVAASAATPPGIEYGTLAGNLYKNPTLGITFQLPLGWNTAKSESLHAINESRELSARAELRKTHPELADSPNITFSKTVLYASRKGEWDGQHVDIPSLRASAERSPTSSINLNAFQKMIVAPAIASGLTLTAPASEVLINKQPFVRADFERTVGSLHLPQARLQTVAGGYLVTFELFAYSPEELQQIVVAFQSIVVFNTNPRLVRQDFPYTSSQLTNLFHARSPSMLVFLGRHA